MASTSRLQQNQGTKLKATLVGARKIAAGIHVPHAFVPSLSDSKRPKVKITLVGHTYRSSIASTGGKFMRSVSNAIREITGVKVGRLDRLRHGRMGA